MLSEPAHNAPEQAWFNVVVGFFFLLLLCIHRVDEQTNVITNIRTFGLHWFACLFVFPLLSDCFFFFLDLLAFLLHGRLLFSIA